MRALLDVNVLIALLDSGHAQHRIALNWFVEHAESGWASCPLTQNGCLRILAQPRYPRPLPMRAVAERLGRFTDEAVHAFWPDGLSVLNPRHVNLERLHGPAQITDAYLLALAVEHEGRLVTFDDRIAIGTVPGATSDNLLRL